jgi:hypothetical protein
VAPAEAQPPLPETPDTTLFQNNQAETSGHTANIVAEGIRSAAISVASVTESAIAKAKVKRGAAKAKRGAAKVKRGAAKARRGAAKARRGATKVQRGAIAAAWHRFRPPHFPGQTPLTTNTGATFPIHRFLRWGEH